jgi:hypothetical protein
MPTIRHPLHNPHRQRNMTEAHLPDRVSSTRPTPFAASPVANADGIARQPNSRLLNIPAEVRLLLYDYMTLSPSTAAHLDWLGAYFACRQLQDEMRKFLKPAKILLEISRLDCPISLSSGYGGASRPTQSPRIPRHITLATPSLSAFGLLQNLTINMPSPEFPHFTPELSYLPHCCRQVLDKVYGMYFNKVTLIIPDAYLAEAPYGDLKNLCPSLFVDRIDRGREINCKAVTFTVKALVDSEGGRDKSFELENVTPRTKIPYVLEIVQDKEGRQSERTYSSAMRFKKALPST